MSAYHPGRRAAPPARPPRKDRVLSNEEACEVTMKKILRNGFIVEHIDAMESVRIGTELGTGVCLVLSAGEKNIYDVRHDHPGVSEALMDMAQDGFDGKVILYGLGFRFEPVTLLGR
ncbi:hypothetical protein GGR56DRAFT_674439 [Xylariaceae sp. FL0804]|nr:hypothetical protein GGR56DRAFT_674439 [Xylariaceae sp. FL0804]